MIDMDMQELYNSNADFRGYVDRLCRTGVYTVQKALTLALTREVAEQYVNDSEGVKQDV